MDAITLLKNDHKAVSKLFREFERAKDDATRHDAVRQIIEELSRHAVIEEQVFYPAVREAVPDTEDTVLESLEEHHIVKWTLSELDGMKSDHERFVAKATVLIENVRHHIEEEEQELFPAVRGALGRKKLAEIGDAMAQAREKAPTRPHPRAPDTPPGNVVAGTAASIADKARDKLTSR